MNAAEQNILAFFVDKRKYDMRNYNYLKLLLVLPLN